MTLEMKKAMRYHYQMLADKGLFSSPTSKDLAKMGVDTASWNEGKGYLPMDLKLEEEITKPVSDEIKIDVTGAKGPEPPRIDNKTAMAQTIKGVINSGRGFKKQDPDESEKVAFTGRKWQGEHWDPEKKEWVTKEGYWWNPVIQDWTPGTPRLGPFYWSFEFMWDPTKYLDPVPYGSFHDEVLHKMEKTRRGIILIPRDHLKTTMFAVNYITYHILELPEKAKMGIINISWDSDLAGTTFMDIKENLEENEKIVSFYGNVIDEDRPKTAEKIFFVYQPIGPKFGLKCTSFKSGSITGTHPYLVIMDDPEDEPLSEKLMKKFKRVMNKKLIPAVGKKGRIYLIGTIKGWDTKNDGYLWLMKNPTWTVMEYPAANKMPEPDTYTLEKKEVPVRDEETGEYLYDSQGRLKTEIQYMATVQNREEYVTLYPERYTIEDLVCKRHEMLDEGEADTDFWSEYFLRPSNPSGNFFLKKRVFAAPPPGFNTVREFIDAVHKKHKNITMFIDPGGAASHGIAVIVGTRFKGNYVFLDFRIFRVGLKQVAKKLIEMVELWDIDTILCEGNFSQKQTYAQVLTDFMKDQCEADGTEHLFRRVQAVFNTGEKYQRIHTHWSNMIGLKDTEIQCYVNRKSKGYLDFNLQLGAFGVGAAGVKSHDYDLLDAGASLNIWAFKRATRAVGIAC